MLQHSATRHEMEVMDKIVNRAWDMVKEGYKDRLTFYMDLDVCHSNGCPLNFDKLLAFPDGDFYHDIWGIRNKIDRQTGKLTDCFLPRCAFGNADTAIDAQEYLNKKKEG